MCTRETEPAERRKHDVDGRGLSVWAPAQKKAGGRSSECSAQQSGRKPIPEGAGHHRRLLFKVPGIKRPPAAPCTIVPLLRPEDVLSLCTAVRGAVCKVGSSSEKSQWRALH